MRLLPLLLREAMAQVAQRKAFLFYTQAFKLDDHTPAARAAARRSVIRLLPSDDEQAVVEPLVAAHSPPVGSGSSDSS